MTAYEGSIYQINSSRGGVPKLPMVSARVTREGIVGDYQNDTRNHGGPMRTLCLYTLDQIKRLQAEGHSIFPGAAGENITLVGIPQALLVPGARLELGDEVIAELTSYTIPCSNLVDCFNDGDFTRISPKLHPGESRIYARILQEGEIRRGDRVRLFPAEVASRPVEAEAASLANGRARA